MKDDGGNDLLEVAAAVSYERLPATYRAPMRRYLGEGDLPAAPLRAVLEGNLSVAIALDRASTLALCQVAEWLDRETPASCHGNRDQVQLWHIYVRRARGRAMLAAMGVAS